MIDLANYKPGTLDSGMVRARWNERIAQVARVANTPSGSSVYGTTSKLQSLSTEDGGDAAVIANRALTVAQEAKQEAEDNKVIVDGAVTDTGENPVSGAGISQAIANALDSVLPIGIIVLCGSPPSFGEWTYKGELESFEIDAYERTG